MYGFHKKVGLSDNSMRASERKNKSPSEYYNQYFRRNHPDLLWLINKPKSNGASGPQGNKGRRSGVKKESGRDGSVDRGSDGEMDGDEDGFVDYPLPGQQLPVPLNAGGGIVQPGGSQPLRPMEANALRQQLQQIKANQDIITQALNRIRVDHSQLIEQATSFQTQHDRHENSINAILTFLATVYNRSLDGHAGNLANMFAGAVPQDMQSSGNVVDVGDETNIQSTTPPLRRGLRRQPLMLTAPPGRDAAGRVTTESPATTINSPYSNTPAFSQDNQRRPNQAPSATIEEVFDATNSARNSESPRVKPDVEDTEFAQAQGQGQDLPQRDIMQMIHNANNSGGNFNGRIDFPAALAHFENSGGNSPLTPSQRQQMLAMMAGNNGANGSPTNNNNALTSPTPPPMPNFEKFGHTSKELDELARIQAEQEAKLQNVMNMVQPLSPSGEIPGLNGGDTNYYGNNPNALDLDQIFNSGDYFTGDGANDFDFANASNGDSSFNFDENGQQGTQGTFGSVEGGEDNEGGKIVGTVNSSANTSPEATVDEVVDVDSGSPTKRRRG
jgi:heat shock transcription factor, other eukaryote